jgi:transcriptional regulator with GAF, ATPase, and Fis domain
MPEQVGQKIAPILENPQSTFGDKIAGIEKAMLLDALERNGWVKLRAARHLKTTYRIFNYKCLQYGLEGLRKQNQKISKDLASNAQK